MSGGVPAGELRDFASLMVDEVIAKVRIQLDAGESLSVADQRLMLEQLIVERQRLSATPTPPIEGRDADVERVRALVEAVEAGKFDALDAVADQWIEGAGIVRMCNAIASVFEAHAPQEIMDRFRAKLTDMMHLAFVEGAAQGTLQARAALQALGERP